MMKMSILVNDVVVVEQEASDETIASFFPNPERVLNTVNKQGWYGFANYDDKEGITTFYKVVPSYQLSTKNLNLKDEDVCIHRIDGSVYSEDEIQVAYKKWEESNEDCS